MTTQQDEQFSAFVDGELDNSNSEIILKRLAGDEKIKQRWYRYHLISDTLRSNLPDNIDPKFSQTIMSAIADEPAILAPQQRKHQHAHSLKHRVAGAAIAASVAMIAVVAVQNMNETNEPAQVAQMPSSNEFVRLAKQPQASQDVAQQQIMMSQQQQQIVPQLFSGSPAMTVSSTQSTTVPLNPSAAELDPRLHQYIVNHNQRASGGQFQGIMPYVRIVVSPGTRQDQDQQ
jgi:negative regulator of sigma E activity